MSSDNQKLIDIKEDELHFINSIIKNVKYLEHMYKTSLIRDEKELFHISNHLNTWEHRKAIVMEHLEMLKDGDSSECIVNDITSLSRFVGNYLDRIEEKKKDVVTNLVPNITQKEWMAAMQNTQSLLESKKDPRVVFTDITVLDNTKGYMVGPVGMYNNSCIEASSTHSFDTLDDLKNWVLQTSLACDMILYMTFEDNGKYYWRGAIV